MFGGQSKSLPKEQRHVNRRDHYLLFCMVDNTIGPVKKRSDAKLYDSEIVTIVLVYSLRGSLYRHFYYRCLFPNLPSLAYLLRLFKRCAQSTDALARNLHTPC